MCDRERRREGRVHSPFGKEGEKGGQLLQSLGVPSTLQCPHQILLSLEHLLLPFLPSLQATPCKASIQVRGMQTIRSSSAALTICRCSFISASSHAVLKVTCHMSMVCSGGPRKCVGDQFALMEGVAVLAVLLKKFDFDLVPGREVSGRPRVREGDCALVGGIVWGAEEGVALSPRERNPATRSLPLA